MPSSRPAIVDRLREATRELHGEVDAESAVAAGGRERYLWFVARLYGFHAAIEPPLAAGLSGAAPALGLDLERRRKAHLFAADLLHFDVRPGKLPRCTALPRLDTPARALGALYVVEGSTLGGAFLLAQLGRTLRIAPGAGASGIAPYGAALRDMWVGYASAVDRFVRAHPEAEPEVIAGARETFEAIIAWLRAPDRPTGAVDSRP
jgi:heme oxygenase